MRYFSKVDTSKILSEGLVYLIQSNRERLRQLLLQEQKGFCAYSERFVRGTDECDIEHFDPRLKETDADNYLNWYAVLSWLNSHKAKKIDKYLPIAFPHDPSIQQRIRYDGGYFNVVDDNDIEAKNLIDFLGLNKHELVLDRKKHIDRIKSLMDLCGGDANLFRTTMLADLDNLNFSTTLFHEFGIDTFAYLN